MALARVTKLRWPLAHTFKADDAASVNLPVFGGQYQNTRGCIQPEGRHGVCEQPLPTSHTSLPDDQKHDSQRQRQNHLQRYHKEDVYPDDRVCPSHQPFKAEQPDDRDEAQNQQDGHDRRAAVSTAVQHQFVIEPAHTQKPWLMVFNTRWDQVPRSWQLLKVRLRCIARLHHGLARFNAQTSSSPQTSPCSRKTPAPPARS